MQSATTVRASETHDFDHFLSDYNPAVVFVRAYDRNMNSLTLSGTPDQLAEFLRCLAEQVDNAKKAMSARASEPLPLVEAS